jgi:hypothetical protein
MRRVLSLACLLIFAVLAVVPTGRAAAPRVAFCQTSYCEDAGIRCVVVGSGRCPNCHYACGPDPSCTAPDMLPTCP